MFKFIWISALGCCVVAAAANMVTGADVPLTEMTAVAFNRTEPISEALAKLYAQQRGIAADHLIGLDCSIEEDVSREDFETTIAAPLREEFKKKQWWTFRT